jgi:DNA-binding beta-propeller fold protein YncE
MKLSLGIIHSSVFHLSIISLALLGPFAATGSAAFSQTAVIDLSTTGNHFGIAFDGSMWHVSDTHNHIYNYDAAFTYLSTSTVNLLDVNLRGLAYDPNSNHLFAANFENENVRELALNGTQIQQFQTDALEIDSVAFDPADNTIWIADFTGTIQKTTRTGQSLFHFTTLHEWTGLAIDTYHDTLLALDNNDTVYEYNFSGTQLGQVIATDLIFGNGLSLTYDPNLGRLYALANSGDVTILDDPTRAVPEPGAAALLLSVALGVALRRERRSCRRVQ